MWNRAKRLIPGGTQLLSKRKEYYPYSYSKAKGVVIDGLIDMASMGIGTCALGYADPDVNRAVKDCIDLGSMSTLNCEEDLELAELLLKLHPWADMVRYARTGGEAMAVAVRIARTYTGKHKVAYCGYHGWHLTVPLIVGGPYYNRPDNDFYQFEYNDIFSLIRVLKKYDIGTIVMEPMRHEYPEGFLEEVSKIADEYDCVLIFDEITIGFRLCVGGSHLHFGVEPDIAVFGKAISNGYPMAAIIGKGGIMDAANETFISSTYWTERIGPTAALTTINKMIDVDLPNRLDKIGSLLKEGLETLGFEVFPPNSLLYFTLEKKEEFVKEMLKRGYIADNAIYLSYCHTPEIIKDYLKVVEEIT